MTLKSLILVSCLWFPYNFISQILSDFQIPPLSEQSLPIDPNDSPADPLMTQVTYLSDPYDPKDPSDPITDSFLTPVT